MDLQIEILTKQFNILNIYETKYQLLEKFIKKHIELIDLIKNNKKIIEFIKLFINKYNREHNILCIECQKILKLFNPAKNDYKFIYGILIQKALIRFLDKIFYKCIDLDKLCLSGSSYKNDCKLYLYPNIFEYFSIKAKKNKTGDIIIINKHSNNRIYNLDDLITIIFIIELNDIIIIPHKDIPLEYIKNNDANILYKSSLFTYIYKNMNEYIIHLTENDEYRIFYNTILHNLTNYDIYNKLYEEFVMV
jgi:hypothetical protein